MNKESPKHRDNQAHRTRTLDEVLTAQRPKVDIQSTDQARLEKIEAAIDRMVKRVARMQAQIMDLTTYGVSGIDLGEDKVDETSFEPIFEAARKYEEQIMGQATHDFNPLYNLAHFNGETVAIERPDGNPFLAAFWNQEPCEFKELPFGLTGIVQGGKLVAMSRDQVDWSLTNL